MRYVVIDCQKCWSEDELRSVSSNPEKYKKRASELKQYYAIRHVMKEFISVNSDTLLFQIQGLELEERQMSLKNILLDSINDIPERDITIHFVGHANSHCFECFLYDELVGLLSIVASRHRLFVNMLGSCESFGLGRSLEHPFVQGFITNYGVPEMSPNPQFDYLDDLLFEDVSAYVSFVKRYVPSQLEASSLLVPFRLKDYWDASSQRFDFRAFSAENEPYKTTPLYGVIEKDKDSL